MAERAYATEERPFEAIRHVAVAITTVRHGQQHVGLLHKQESTSEVLLLHLAWHHELKNSHPKAYYMWVDPPVPTARARQVATLCRQVYRSNIRGIPYAFSMPNDCFSRETGEFLLGPNHLGLTCASFVLAVFDVAGLPLVQYSSWPVGRDRDKDWQREVIEQLRAGGASEKHITLVEAQLGSVRYRPEQVAGAAASPDLPVHFEVTERLGQVIVEKLRKKRMSVQLEQP